MDNLSDNRNPPPIPQRQGVEPPLWQNYNQYSLSMSQPFAFHQPYGNLYNNYGYQSPYNFTPNNPSSFAEFSLLKNAEESSKTAFQSIESVVNAFVSVVYMLNSTHNAVFNSFRALIGVVDQFRVLKNFFISNVVISIIRQIQFIWRRLLAFLRLKPRNYANSESIWQNIKGQKEQSSTFNIVTFLFWLIAIGGPYLVYKWIAKMTLMSAEESKNNWSKGLGEHYTAQALYNFNGLNPDELSFSALDNLRIAPKRKQPNIKNWLLASNNDGSKIGLIPINYIKLLSKVEKTEEMMADR